MSSSLTPETAIRYSYDDAGRLKRVFDPGQGSAIFGWDRVGNLLSITRSAASALTVAGFNPERGEVGTAVTIHGSGFGSTPSQNEVRFNNGPLATVTSATNTELAVTVPAGQGLGAGRVTVKVGTPVATSDSDFTVLGVRGPSVTGVSPSVADPGSDFTVTGARFEPDPGLDAVRVNGRRAWAKTPASDSSVTVTVPDRVGSGRVSLATPFGSSTDRTCSCRLPALVRRGSM